ncbi:hypothetical protein [Catellatospora methionotrophica]|uniref:hypothetical protein n=1 Tax=Catellatospora methionotrophica TaxID=121620 RepID=UPI0033F86858
MSEPGDSLVADRVDSTTWFSGVGIAESLDMLIDGIDNGSWIDGTLGGATLVIEGAAWALDPFGMLVTAGFGWVVEHVEPLSWCLDQLAGDPDQLRANAQTWRNIAAEHRRIADGYGRGTVADLPDWTGDAAAAYATHAQRSMEMLFALSKIGECMAVIVEASSSLVEAVRTIVRDLIGECIATLLARLPLWTAEEVFTFGLATPVVAAQVGTVVARWAAKIARIMKALVRSLGNLIPVIRQVDTGMGTYIVFAKRQQPELPGRGGRGVTPTSDLGGLTRPPDPTSQAGDVGLVADRIAEHAGQRGIPGVDDADMAGHLEDVMRANPGHRVRDTPNGTPRYVWWDPDTGTIIIREGDRGTFMQPDNGYAYYLQQLNE